MEQLTSSSRLLVLADDAGIVESVLSASRCEQWQLDVATSAWDALEKLHSGAAVDLLVVELLHGEVNGFQILRWLRKIRPEVPMIVVDRGGDAGRRQEVLQLGARDYLTNPCSMVQLERAIQRHLLPANDAMHTDITSNDIESLDGGQYFVGLCPRMRRLRAQVDFLAECDSPVLICGEPGSGKETTARLLHQLSIRSGFRFASVDCAALPEELLAREIFAIARPGPMGTQRGRCGKLELCSRGTLFLDEIADLPWRLQALLSAVLESGRMSDPESSEILKVDVRVVAATSVSIDKALADRRLVPQLYRQLCSSEITVPPLRERRGELPSLSQHFMHQLSRRYGLPRRDFSAEVMEEWGKYSWPGNLRELEQAVKRYLVSGEDAPDFCQASVDGINTHSVAGDSDHSAIVAATWPGVKPASEFEGPNSLRSILQAIRERAERNAIASALETTGWNRKAAARLLRISYRSILYKISLYHMSSYERNLLQPSDGLEPRNSARNEAHRAGGPAYHREHFSA